MISGMRIDIYDMYNTYIIYVLYVYHKVRTGSDEHPGQTMETGVVRFHSNSFGAYQVVCTQW